MTSIPDHARDGARKLSDADVRDLLREVPEWRRSDDKIVRRVEVKDFRAALRLVQRAGEAAERENHHPDIAIRGWNKVTFELSTHDAKGLSENDFVLAREIDRILMTE